MSCPPLLLFILSNGMLLHERGSVDAQDGSGVPHHWCLVKRFRCFGSVTRPSKVSHGIEDLLVELLPEWDPPSIFTFVISLPSSVTSFTLSFRLSD